MIDHDLQTARRWILCHWGEVLTVNKERTEHWSSRAEAVRNWREAFYWLARDIAKDGPIKPCHIDVVPVRPNRRIQDVGACLPSAKAAIDGCVDAGVWPDDSPEHIYSITFWPQQIDRSPGLRLIITETSRRTLEDFDELS